MGEGFNSILSKWKKAEEGNKPFQVAEKAQKVKKHNADGIKEYKKDLKEKKGFKERRASRGRSINDRPAQLKNVFGKQVKYLSKFVPPVFSKSKRDAELIQEAMTRHFFFSVLSESEKSTFMQAFEPFTVAKGTDIITQGDSGDYFFVVSEGTVNFFVDGKNVGTAETGASFGELGLLYTCPRSATVTADAEPTKLLRVDQQTFRSILQKHTKVKEEEKLKLLRSVDFLAVLGGSDLSRLGRAMALRTFESGDYIVKKGDEGDAFYIVQDGEVKVTDISVGDQQFDDVLLKPGQYFGERALATKEPRAANVVAVTKGSAFFIDKDSFEKVLGSFSRVVMRCQDRRVLEGVDVLCNEGLHHKQFEELSQYIVDKTFDAGDEIFNSLYMAEAALYVVREGTVQLSGKRNDLIKPGGYFGEDQLLHDARMKGKKDQSGSTKTIPKYTAVAAEKCHIGILTLVECRTVFTTKDMTLPATEEGTAEEEEKAPEQTKAEGDDDDSDDDLAAAAMMPATRSLNRDTTKQWLDKSSIEVLRACVKKFINMDDLNRDSVLGEGQFGEVWLVSANLPGDFGMQHFALKIQMKDDPTRGDSVDAIKREIDVLGKMDHPYIVNLIHQYEDPEHLNILMALVHGGELFDVIHTENDDGTWSSGLPESDAKFYAMVITDTLDYIHRRQYVYRDLKPENVLIDKDGYPVICDFGFAKFVADKTYTLCGTPNYLSPEVILNKGHNWSSDHWSLGVLIYEMVAGENPFYYDGMPQMELFQTIVKEKFYPLPDEVSDQAFYVIDELLEKDPYQRLGCLANRGKAIMAKEWFSELNLADLREKKVKAPFIPKNRKLEEAVQRSSQTLLSNSQLGFEPLGGCTASSYTGKPSTAGLLDDDSSDED